MKHIPSALRLCISIGAALAALAPRIALATDQVCAGPGMAVFERDAGISAVDSWGTWLRLLPGAETLEAAGSVENLELCRDPVVRVSPQGEQVILWHRDGTKIFSVTSEGTVVTELPEGDRLWAADVAFVGADWAVIAALLYRVGEEPRLAFLVDAAPGLGELSLPFETTGAKCGMGTTAVSATSAGEVVALCEGSFTVFTGLSENYNIATFPLELTDAELVVAAVEPEPIDRISFFGVVRDTTDEIGRSYDLMRFRLNASGFQRIDVVLEDVAYAGGDHGLAVFNDLNAVYMGEEGLVQVVGSRYGWSTGVIHPLRPEAKLAAKSNPPRVLISEYDAELLTLTDDGWERETLFELGIPPASPSESDGGSGCSVAGVDPATGLGQVLLVMLALALATAPRLARGRGTAHDGAACSPRCSRR